MPRVTPAPPDKSSFFVRLVYFFAFAGLAVLASTVVTEGVRAMSPPGSGAQGAPFGVAVHALAGAAVGALAAYRCRAGGAADEAVHVDALALSISLAAGAAVAEWLAPLGTSIKLRSALTVWPPFVAGAFGAALAAARGGKAAPTLAADASGRPLTVGEQAAAQQALTVLDTLERTLARVADPAAARPDEAETARFCDADEIVGERCGRLPAGHAVTRALREAGHALTSAVELHYVAHGWHDDLGLEAGDPEGIAVVRRRWSLEASEPAVLAGALAARARIERQTVERFVATARTSV